MRRSVLRSGGLELTEAPELRPSCARARRISTGESGFIGIPAGNTRLSENVIFERLF
jgi:hypothetical protein